MSQPRRAPTLVIVPPGPPRPDPQELPIVDLELTEEHEWALIAAELRWAAVGIVAGLLLTIAITAIAWGLATALGVIVANLSGRPL